MPNASHELALQRMGLGSRAAIALGYLLAYLSLDWVSYTDLLQGLNITPWHPQAAAAVALLMWNRRWLWVVWAGLLGAEVIVRGLPTSWFAALLSSVVLTLGYAAIARAATNRLGSPAKLSTRRDFAVLLIIIIVGSLVNGLLYVGALAVGGTGLQGAMAAAVARFWVGDAVGLLVTLPLLLVFCDATRRAESLALLRAFECWLIAIAIALATSVAFGSDIRDHFKLLYLLFVPVVWAAARFGVTGATLAAALTQVLVIVAVQSLEHQALAGFELQSLMAALAATGLLLGTIVDERERAASELRGSLPMAAIGDMAAAMAHELSQALTAVNSYARACQLLARELGADQSAQRVPLVEMTQKLVDEAQRASEVVKRLRDFFRTGSTQLQLVEVSQLVDEVMRSQLRRAQALGVAVEWSCETELPRIWMDRVEIAVVLRKFVSNAIDAASQHGAPGRVNVNVGLDQGQLLVSGRDGAGTPAALTPRLFEPQASTKPGGMDIGLSISRAIVEAHGGHLRVEAGPGGRFCFTLPLPSNHNDE